MGPILLVLAQLCAQAAPVETVPHGGQDANAAAELACQTQALCTPQQAVNSGPSLRQFLTAVRAWAVAWDALERPPQALAQLTACIEEPAQQALVHSTIDDLTGAWAQGAERCARALPQAPKLYRSELGRCRAVGAVREGRVAHGAALLQAGLEADPHNPELYLSLAQVQLAQDLPHSAHHTLAPLLGLDGGTEAQHLKRARTLVDEAASAAAPPLTPLDRLEQADVAALMESSHNDADDVAHVVELAHNTQQPQLWSSCALVLLRGPDPALGRELLHRAEQALPLDADPSRLLAVYHLSQADYPAALAALMRAVRKQPFDAENQVMLASVAARLDAWDISHGAYKALVQLEPDRDSHRAGLRQAKDKWLRQTRAAAEAGKSPRPRPP